MNKVYLSGVIVENPTLITTEQGATHLVLNLSVSHRNKAGIKSELYRVNAWNNAAIWGNTNLRRGQHIMVQGYLSQRPARGEGETAFDVDVTAEEFFTGSRVAAPTEAAQAPAIVEDQRAS